MVTVAQASEINIHIPTKDNIYIEPYFNVTYKG